MTSKLINNYFSELNEQWPGMCMSLEIEKMLWDEKSKFQHVQVFKSKTFGNVLVLDGVIQLTERDEMSYQEMITHLPMFSHPNPESVCIVGGGDGGVIREVLKHKCVKNVTICEIDEMVITVGKKFFPTVANCWDDKRVTLVCDDAAKFMASDDVKQKFDVIICDSSDPVGPAGVLFESKFFCDMEHALKAGGRISTQGESVWLHLDLIERLLSTSKNMFASVEYATTQIPTYPAGQIGHILCAKAGGNVDPQLKKPVRVPDKDMVLRYYTPELHEAAFVLPAFAKKVVDAAKAKNEKDVKESKTKEEKVSKEETKEKETEKEKEQEKEKEPEKEEETKGKKGKGKGSKRTKAKAEKKTAKAEEKEETKGKKKRRCCRS
eukprot:TRINITY_DN7391_c0_g1_i1.p1 TRINITY_DN7391_c0_g1~~TRINITY_DN7391_c0_g1_i1.p1  ORF type:complete len:379 (+),score=125.63 TRINITY_DN7391_c0_g1_i1:47-1183(+)